MYVSRGNFIELFAPHRGDGVLAQNGTLGFCYCTTIISRIHYTHNGSDNPRASLLLMGLTIFIASLSGALRAYRCGPADVVVVSADGLIAVPSSSVHTPSALTPFASESIGANLWLAVRYPLLALTPFPENHWRLGVCGVGVRRVGSS